MTRRDLFKKTTALAVGAFAASLPCTPVADAPKLSTLPLPVTFDDNWFMSPKFYTMLTEALSCPIELLGDVSNFSHIPSEN